MGSSTANISSVSPPFANRSGGGIWSGCGCFLCMLDNPCTCRPIQYAPCAERHGWTFTRLGRFNGGFGGGIILISAILLYVMLSTTNTALMPLAKLVFLGHIPVALVEGIISFWLIHFLQKVNPSLLGVSS